MSVSWLKIYQEVEGCANISDVEKLLVSCGVEKNDVVMKIKQSVSHYAYGRNYRANRNVSMKEMRREIIQLRKEAGKE